MERIYWIGTGLAKCFGVRRHQTVHRGNHDAEWKPVDEIRYYDDDQYERGQMRRLSAQEQLPDFQEAHDWLWGEDTPHKEFEATEEGMKDLLNALCYTKGGK